ncbi:DNA (cytosine-5)-methyltransferase 1 [Streptosporangium becharense]|uniref:Cytosine-specific methyltransferase n=1 Tax=Streptosporangium becharense TaxID=1816182 RepID=A0A7W9IIB2_9ACTN|nr:DNA (cytosine-5-)-methyltransferase [Streptosporangium becharense]MBB2914644.1 DNA (cytosine-5)-methyltransferase 1 [Streptosporangium becharense]MBB5820955.1 DNA (cytosine-5)-methyltransferase 1 [Streptosporangium becharense]
MTENQLHVIEIQAEVGEQPLEPEEAGTEHELAARSAGSETLAAEREDVLEVVEICAGAGGQSLGLERAGFRHVLAVELDRQAAETLRHNLVEVLGYDEKEAADTVKIGDVADSKVWDPDEYRGVDLLAGGVPCPPFSIAGKQLGATDERDLFAWAVELCGRIKPKALLLENVKGLSGSRFTAYRQRVLDRLSEYGYIAEWRLLHADDYGVSQLRPRFVLVALMPEYAEYFEWPKKHPERPLPVGELLRDLMAKGDWSEDKLEEWVQQANKIAPTIVGGSKKHGGADLGPSRAKAAWEAMGVDAKGVADEPPGLKNPRVKGAPHPMLTVDMVARIQGWYGEDFAKWEFLGKKTSQYRQIGNAFPPPVAKELGVAIRRALRKEGERRVLVEETDVVLDPVYRVLLGSSRPLTVEQIVERLAATNEPLEQPEVERHLNHLRHDFELISVQRSNGDVAYQLGEFKAFLGQEDHQRHDLFSKYRSKIS